jgi:hypothetical protein
VLGAERARRKAQSGKRQVQSAEGWICALRKSRYPPPGGSVPVGAASLQPRSVARWSGLRWISLRGIQLCGWGIERPKRAGWCKGLLAPTPSSQPLAPARERVAPHWFLSTVSWLHALEARSIPIPISISKARQCWGQISVCPLSALHSSVC